ncbi:MAG TPA: BatA domain-containing protein [Phycisphaerae bacterium]|nr:BatA domain-containing protein [Phycisphaerae bacterium]HUT59364.1 BatA domain-containing protein [Phycisphaerae bacterium]
MLAWSFLFPTVLYAGAAAAAPVLIHLILRTKPRKIVFPAMRFVRKTHRSTLKMLKLKHLILLAMRMAVIVLMAVLIARGRIPQWRSVEDRSVPTAAVVVIDNSGSMNYRYKGQSLISWSKQQAQRLIAMLPAGSRAAVIATGGQGAAGLVDPSLAVQQVVEVPASCNHASVATALLQAAEIVRRSELARKEVYLLTDMTARSWRDEFQLPEDQRISYTVLHTGGEDLNVRLDELRLSSPGVQQGGQVKVETTVSSVNVGGEMTVVAELDGQSVSQETVTLAAGGAAPVVMSLTPQRQGVVHGRVILKNPDPLEMDNVRYFTLQVGPQANVLILCSTGTIATTGFLMGNAVSPATGESSVRRQTITAEQLDAGRLKGTRVVMLAEAASLSETQWRLLEPFVRAGGGLWIVAGPLMSRTAYNAAAAQRLMPVALAGMEQMPRPVRWGAADTDHPMLRPFKGSDNPPLSDVMCLGRFKIASKAEDAKVILEYADGVPAIAVRRIGAGTVVFWNFSPLPALSNLAPLAQLPILSMRTVAVLTAEVGSETMYDYGQTVVIPIPRSLTAAVVTVRRPGDETEQPLLPEARRPVVSLSADALGAWQVRFTQAEQRLERGFSVNAEAAESDLTPIDEAEVLMLLPRDRTMITSDIAAVTQRRKTVSQPLDITPLVLLGLLALMTGESFFANRFYRRSDTPTAL